jgi:hypothetical protein
LELDSAIPFKVFLKRNKVSEFIIDETVFKVGNHLHCSFEKSIIERTIQYIKDRTESFDDYFPCTKEKCKLKHIMNWFNLFVNMHNKVIEKKIVVN